MRKNVKSVLGSKFGTLTVIEEGLKSGRKEYLMCKCNCGVVKRVRKDTFLSGRTKSCGSQVCNGLYIDYTGKTLDGVKIISEYKRSENGRYYVRCLCKHCGKEFCDTKTNVTRGKRKYCTSCSSMKNPDVPRSGALCIVWRGMLKRCKNKNNMAYSYYGGRGISVCEDWNDYEKFLRWAQDNGYEHGLTLERIDVNGNYCPGNCTWVTMQEQNMNKRTTMRFIAFGKEQVCAKKFAKEHNVSYWKLLKAIKSNSVDKFMEDCK